MTFAGFVCSVKVRTRLGTYHCEWASALYVRLTEPHTDMHRAYVEKSATVEESEKKEKTQKTREREKKWWTQRKEKMTRKKVSRY